MGLEIGATHDDIHSAFRKLARELHPDVTGQKNSARFQQVTGAYTLLKSLAPEELSSLTQNLPGREKARIQKAEQKRREESQKAERSAKIDRIITRYEAEFHDYCENRKSGSDSDMKAIILRMKSGRPGVINAALKHSAPFANRVDFRKALTEILKRSEIDPTTAD
ncbi:MAG: DnaJ domain-containing protein, partial [Synergistaceae bacterium]|nr:DnaJ domain-containing protein [Synergistaceae bacterium]